MPLDLLTGGYSNGNVPQVDVLNPTTGKVTPIPYPTESDVFVVRWYVGNVYCQSRGSILYFGGYTLRTELIPSANIVAGLKIATGKFETLNGAFGGEVLILTTKTPQWIQRKSGQARTYTACTIAGDQLLIWGGQIPGAPGALASVVPTPLLIYNMATDTWGSSYVASPVPPSGSTTTSAGLPTGTSIPDHSPKSNISAIVGSIIGGLAVIGAISGFFSTDDDGSNRGSLNAHPLPSVRRGMLPAVGIKERDQGRDQLDLSRKDKHKERLKENLENQQKQLGIKRQLLALQKQEQQLRSPSAISPHQQSYFPPPSSPPPRQPSYEYHALDTHQPKPTVQALTNDFIAVAQEVPGNATGVRQSALYQDTTEPTYGLSPVTVPSWYPGLEYQEEAKHNGVEWIRQANAPHAVVNQSTSKGDTTEYHN
ncbi:hypothetical protein BGX33_011161 [Mortierella sp. NVP41]|nr:hypothetical protein BGX33_011161 [Mortierella sp. NVP41]